MAGHSPALEEAHLKQAEKAVSVSSTEEATRQIGKCCRLCAGSKLPGEVIDYHQGTISELSLGLGTE